MDKSPDAFRSIGEVSRLVGAAPHVLRYWESQFSQLSPVKRGDGRRYYRPDDVRLVAGLCQVLREEGLSIRGAKRLIAADRGAGLRQIGAARLGEMMGEQLAESRRSDNGRAAPAVRLAVPEPAEMPPQTVVAKPSAAPTDPVSDRVANRTVADRIDVTRAAARKRKPAEPSLPLFPDLDPAPTVTWLTRLVASAASLRACQTTQAALPAQALAQAQAIRDALAAAQ